MWSLCVSSFESLRSKGEGKAVAGKGATGTGDAVKGKDDGTDKAVFENDSDKENKSEDESSDKPSKTAKKAKKEEDDDKYK